MIRVGAFVRPNDLTAREVRQKMLTTAARVIDRKVEGSSRVMDTMALFALRVDWVSLNISQQGLDDEVGFVSQSRSIPIELPAMILWFGRHTIVVFPSALGWMVCSDFISEQVDWPRE